VLQRSANAYILSHRIDVCTTSQFFGALWDIFLLEMIKSGAENVSACLFASSSRQYIADYTSRFFLRAILLARPVLFEEVIMSWTNEPSLADPRQGLAATTSDAPSPASGYRIYAIGGDDGSGPVATAAAYDTLARAWSTVASMPTARLNLAATSGPGLLYALGGSTGSSALATHEIYDAAADAWSSSTPLPTARSGLAAVTGRDGLIYAVGGYDGTYLTTVEAFDPTTESWTTKASMPTARAGLTAVTGPDGLIYAMGGQNSGASALDTVEVFNPATNSWTTGVSLPAARYGLAAAVGPDSLIYAMGGVDASGSPQTSVYSYDPATGAPWTSQASLLTAQAFLAADTGPDGLIYAIGGENFTEPALGTVEAFTVATAQPAPDPYVGNGTYQSPDIILLDSSGNPVPIGGAPGGAWDTLLQPNTYYGIQTVLYNDSTVAATNTTVKFWHFPGGVGTMGTLIDTEPTITVPANGSVVVTSASPFQSGAAGQHECVAVSVANPESLYFNVDPTMGTEVIDPTVAHPAGSGHYGSAWRNTNSVVLGPGMGWRLSFPIRLPRLVEPVGIKLSVTTTHVPVGWERTGMPAEVGNALKGACGDLRLPLFLVPALRRTLPTADLGVRIKRKGGGEDAPYSAARAEFQAVVRPGEEVEFTVSGVIPHHAQAGDIFLVNIAARYPRTSSGREGVVEYLEVIYVKQ
jgi:N-acetylneuraminic acid mutarotase